MSDIREVLSGEEIAEVKIREILNEASLIEDDKSSIDLKQFSKGYSNLTYLISTENKEFVLRRPPLGAIKRGHDMAREYKILSALNGHWNKVPEVYFFDDTQLLGVPFYIMERVKGIIIRNEKRSESEFQQIAETWLKTFVELHNLDTEILGLSDFGRPQGYVKRQVSNWSKQYIAAKTKEVDEAGFVMNWLAEHQVESEDYSLIHNDFRYDNVVFKDQSFEQINAVLDWEMATIGDPLMDLGTTLGYWTVKSDPGFLQKGLPSSTIFPGNPGRSELVERYALLTRRSVDHILFYYIYGLFKIAVIAQQIFYRYQKGLTKDPKFKNLESASEGLCKMAKYAIQKKRID
ncbi:phosphotransferase family protein [Portibacter marinus]|uniref:phosphotransferase family protein n=1 Tax=Portibacter marinus TaxID=2898660 RepID=UPI001F252194|nr:phosphotransferase family protein [Portibacter marinus]